MKPPSDHQVPLPTKEQAAEIIRPIRDELRQAIKNAIADWGRTYEDVRHILSPRTQSNIIHDHIVHHAKDLLAPKGVKTYVRRGIFTVAVEAADVRFKKLGARLRSNNVRTNQQSKYSLQLRLDGFPDAPRLTAGYVLDHLRLALEQAVVTLQVGREVRYAIPLGDDAGQTILDFPAPKTTLPAASNKRVRPKKTQQEQTKE